MCERAVLTNRLSLDLSPFVLEGHESLSGSEGQIRCLPQPEQLQGFEPEPSKEGSWMMAQNDLVVVGIDVAKDKVDACVRSLALRETYPCSAKGRRELVSWLRKHKIGKAVMEASGGYDVTGPRRCARTAWRADRIRTGAVAV